jgi:hypothetical protein
MLLPKVAAVRSQLDPSIDVVFVIDKSTSMEDEQQRLRDNAQVIFDTLQQETSGFFRVAVVTYGGNRASAFTVKYLSLTTDRMAFIDAIDAIENRGGTEPAYNALIETMTDSIPLTETADGTFIEGLPQPTGAFPQLFGFCPILVTDEGSGSEVAVINALINANAFSGFTEPEEAYDNFVTESGGVRVDLADFNDNPADNLASIIVQ